jgi:hypothetical protein
LTQPNKLPDFLQPYFWDCDFLVLSWGEQRDFIVRRLLQSGSWQALTWLRAELGDAELRRWIEDRRGAGLSPRQLRFWAAILGLPQARVTRWVYTAAGQPWERRLGR